MLIWRLCYSHSFKQGGYRASDIVGTSFALALQRLKSPCGAARDFHSVGSGDTRLQGFARLPVAAAGRNKKGGAKDQGKRDFHATQTAEYKSGPGTKKWRYDNILSKPAPKPVCHSPIPAFNTPKLASEGLKACIKARMRTSALCRVDACAGGGTGSGQEAPLLCCH